MHDLEMYSGLIYLVYFVFLAAAYLSMRKNWSSFAKAAFVITFVWSFSVALVYSVYGTLFQQVLSGLLLTTMVGYLIMIIKYDFEF